MLRYLDLVSAAGTSMLTENKRQDIQLSEFLKKTSNTSTVSDFNDEALNTGV